MRALHATVACVAVALASSGCVGDVRHARQPAAQRATEARRGGVQVAAVVGPTAEEEAEAVAGILECLARNGVRAGRSCGIGCTIGVRREEGAAAIAILQSDPRWRPFAFDEPLPRLP